MWCDKGFYHDLHHRFPTPSLEYNLSCKCKCFSCQLIKIINNRYFCVEVKCVMCYSRMCRTGCTPVPEQWVTVRWRKQSTLMQSHYYGSSVWLSFYKVRHHQYSLWHLLCFCMFGVILNSACCCHVMQFYWQHQQLMSLGFTHIQCMKNAVDLGFKTISFFFPLPHFSWSMLYKTRE